MPPSARARVQCTCTLLPYPHECSAAVKRRHELGQSRLDRYNAEDNARREHTNGPQWQDVTGFNDDPIDEDDHPLLEEDDEQDEQDNPGCFAQRPLLTVENEEDSDSAIFIIKHD